jgi:predicted NBD/HSP70 family sugar kinase
VDLSYVEVGNDATAGHVVGGQLQRRAPDHACVLGRVASDQLSDAELTRVARAARRGDHDAIAWVSGVADQLSVSLLPMMDEINPGIIVLGGPLARAREVLLAPCRRVLRRRGASVITRALGETAVTVGAAALVLEAALAGRVEAQQQWVAP